MSKEPKRVEQVRRAKLLRLRGAVRPVRKVRSVPRDRGNQGAAAVQAERDTAKVSAVRPARTLREDVLEATVIDLSKRVIALRALNATLLGIADSARKEAPAQSCSCNSGCKSFT